MIKEEKNLYVTELGEAVNDIMKHSFPQIVDESFTARMEARLDQVAEGQEEWKNLLRGFVPDLLTDVEKAEQELEKVQIADEETDVICENCGRNMVIKYGPSWQVSGLPGISRVQEYEAVLGEGGSALPEVWRRDCGTQDEEGAPLLCLREKPGM